MIHQRLKLISLFVLMCFLNSEKVSGCDEARQLQHQWQMISGYADFLTELQKAKETNMNVLILKTTQIADEILRNIPKALESEIGLWIDSLIEKTCTSLRYIEAKLSSAMDKNEKIALGKTAEKAKAILFIMLKVKERRPKAATS